MNWYLLHAQPNKDAYAKEHLINQGYEVYRPLARRLRKRGKRQIMALESLFPRYLFLRGQDSDPNWMAIRSTRGISGYISYQRDGEPSIVPHSIITDIKAAESDFDERSIDLDQFKKGDQILINNHCFNNIKAIFSHYDGNERAIVLLSLFSAQSKPAPSLFPLSAIS